MDALQLYRLSQPIRSILSDLSDQYRRGSIDLSIREYGHEPCIS